MPRWLAAAAKLFDVAHSLHASSDLHAATAQLCRMAVTSRYGELDDAIFAKAVQAYLDSEVAQW